MIFLSRGSMLLTMLACLCDVPYLFAEDATTGKFSGKIELSGKMPVLPPLVKKNHPETKDAAVCAATSIPDESLVVDPQSRGIANVFVYLRKRPDFLSMREAAPELEPFVLEQKGCRYVPHAMIVRTNQTVKVINRDEVLGGGQQAQQTRPCVIAGRLLL